MTFDLREGEEPATAVREAEERPDAERRVAWYFGDLLDEVSAEYPVARHRLVAVLSDMDVRVRAFDLADDRTEPLRHPNAPGRVVRLPLQLWTVLEETGDLSEEELRAARAVHRRMSESLLEADAETDPSAPPFVLAAEPSHLE